MLPILKLLWFKHTCWRASLCIIHGISSPTNIVDPEGHMRGKTAPTFPQRWTAIVLEQICSCSLRFSAFESCHAGLEQVRQVCHPAAVAQAASTMLQTKAKFDLPRYLTDILAARLSGPLELPANICRSRVPVSTGSRPFSIAS